jgi:hypothetical protein
MGWAKRSIRPPPRSLAIKTGGSRTREGASLDFLHANALGDCDPTGPLARKAVNRIGELLWPDIGFSRERAKPGRGLVNPGPGAVGTRPRSSHLQMTTSIYGLLDRAHLALPRLEDDRILECWRLGSAMYTAMATAPRCGPRSMISHRH